MVVVVGRGVLAVVALVGTVVDAACCRMAAETRGARRVCECVRLTSQAALLPCGVRRVEGCISEERFSVTGYIKSSWLLLFLAIAL